jgi:cytoskeletal protein CcmA (bactofilin family)
MWGKQQEETQPPTQKAPATPPSAPAQPVAKAAAPPVAKDAASQPTVFGPSMRIVGEVSSNEELYLNGDLEGKLSLQNKLTIGPNSKVKANIKAKEIVIFGTVHGNVEAENRIALRTGATIVGDIKTAGIVIEDGAYFKGGIDISRPDGSKTEQRAQASAVSAAQRR